MKNLKWLALGVIGGFIAAHLINKDPRGHEMFEQLDSRITAFTDHMSDAYQKQQSALASIASDAAESVKSAVVDAQTTN